MHTLATRFIRLDRPPPARSTIRLFKLILIAGEFLVFLLSFGAVIGLGLVWLYGFRQLPIPLGILLWLPSGLLVFLVGGYLFLIINSVYCGLFPVSVTRQQLARLKRENGRIKDYIEAVTAQKRGLTYAEFLAMERFGSSERVGVHRTGDHLPRGTNKSVIVPS